MESITTRSLAGRSNPSSLGAVLLSLLFLFLAGCVGGGDAPASVEARVVGDACHGAAEEYCILEDGVLRLVGLRMDGGGSPYVGLSVSDLSVPLLLEDIHVTGFGTAIAIQKTCGSCDVTVKSSLLEARGTALEIGLLATMESRLLIENTTLRIPSTTDMSGIGLQIVHTSGQVILRDVELVGSGDSGIGVRGVESADLELRGVNIAGFGSAGFGRWTDLVFVDTNIECVRGGFSDAHAQNVFIDGLRINGCTVECEGVCAALVLGAFNSGSQVFDARNLTITDNEEGLITGDFETIRITDFNVSNNRLQGMTVIGVDAVVRDGVVQANGGNGASLGAVERFVVDGVVFKDNGLEYIRSPLTNFGLRISGSADGEYIIRNSSFVGNRVWGLNGDPAYPGVVDASWNWWGSPLGPSPPTPYALGNPPVPGFGDLFNGRVITEPHLAVPP